MGCPPVLTRDRQRAVLLPLGMVLAGLALLLETTGFVLRTAHAHGVVRRVLSMDAPLSVPRMYVATVFAAAAAAALMGARSRPWRRPWMTAVGVVGGLIAAVKASGTLHVAALRALDGAIGPAAAQVVSSVIAFVALAALWRLRWDDRRDRRRVLGMLGCYAIAAVWLSALSRAAVQTGGLAAAATATYVEEAAEAMSGVGFLVAVLVGVTRAAGHRRAPTAALPVGRAPASEHGSAEGTVRRRRRSVRGLR
jgi:hypothetical protein